MNRRDRHTLGAYQRCSCGKVAAASVDDARRLRREISARTGHFNECRYYTCSYGWTHWTEQLETPTLLRKAS